MSARVHGEREILHFGGISLKVEKKLFRVLEQLEEIVAIGGTVCDRLANEVRGLDPKFIHQYVRVGLWKDEKPPKTLGDLHEDYCNYKLKKKSAKTVRGYRSYLNKIEEYFGAGCRIDSILPGDVKRFLAAMDELGRADSTIDCYLKRGAQAFNHAIDNRWVKDNPFTGIGERADLEKRMSEEDKKVQLDLVARHIDDLLACPKSRQGAFYELEWNAFVNLLRWTGARRSELLVLRWSDIDFAHGEIRMRGKGKGRKSDEKPIRYMPLWPELIEPLERLRSASDDNATHVLNRMSRLAKKPEFDKVNSNGDVIVGGRWSTNPGETFKKILTRNGIEVWQQPFHGIRRFRINELERTPGYLTSDIREWTGNSEAVAISHYSVSGTDQDRRRWAAEGFGATSPIPHPGQSDAAVGSPVGSWMPPEINQNAPQENSDHEKPFQNGRSESIRSILNKCSVAREGLEPPTKGL